MSEVQALLAEKDTQFKDTHQTNEMWKSII